MALANVFNEESFNPARLSNLSLWLDAQAGSTFSSSSFTKKLVSSLSTSFFSSSSNGTIVSAFTTLSSIRVSSPGGLNFQTVDVSSGATASFTDIAISPDASLILICTQQRGAWVGKMIGGVWSFAFNSLPNPAGASSWRTCASSETGQFLILLTGQNLGNNPGNGPAVWSSSDFGVSWLSNKPPGFRGNTPRDSAMSYSGQFSLHANTCNIATQPRQPLILSSNFCTSFFVSTVSDFFTGVAMDTTGKFMYTCAIIVGLSTTGGIYVNSNFGSGSWASIQPPASVQTWNSICCSPDGSVVYSVNTSGLYVGSNFGATWTGPFDVNGSLGPAITAASNLYMVINANINNIITTPTLTWSDKSSSGNTFLTEVTSSGFFPSISNTLVNQPSVFLPPGAQMVSSLSSGLVSSKSIFMVYQCVSPQSVMRFSVGKDVSGQAFGFAQSNSTVYSPYQYGYGDTKWTVDANTYILPNFVSGIVDVSATMIRGDYNFNAGANVRETALQNIIENTPYTLGTSTVSSSVFVSASFHVCEIIAYNRALSTTDRQMIEGYVAWKWNMVTRLPNGHPYQKFPPSGEQVIDPATPSNIFTGLVSWIDMADTSTYTLSGTFLKTLNDKVGGSFTISGRPDSLPVSTIGGLPSLNFPGNVTRTITALTNPFLYKTLLVPSEGCAIAVMIPSLQFTAAKLGIFGWGAPGNGSNNPGLGYTPETNNLPAAIQSYNTATSVFFGPSLRPTIGSPAIIFWAWYGGNMVYLSSNGNTILSSPQTAGVYDKTSTNNIFYIGNDEGLGANFNLGELCVYDGFLETPFRNIMEGYLAWKWGMTQFLPTNHPHYLASPTLQTLTEVNALSQPADISGLTMWVDAADTATTINTVITPSVVLTGSYTFLATSGGYDYYRFTGNGTVQTNVPLSVQYLAVGGGGGGGGGAKGNGGGGSGGLKTNTSIFAFAGQSLAIPFLMPDTTYTITIGGGGIGGVAGTPATNGDSTTFTGTGIDVVANGGGAGLSNTNNDNGGSPDTGSGAGGGSAFTEGVGSKGGGGGGGVLTYGGNCLGLSVGGNGGDGLVFLSVPFGGGGGGGGTTRVAVGGSAGGTMIGGSGRIGGVSPTPGVANTGSGGGGAVDYTNGRGGGSGVFILGIPSILPTIRFTWLDKSAVSNNLVSSGYLPTISNFGTPLRPSIYFGPRASLQSTYNSGANSGQFSAFLVASAPASSYLLISTGQITRSTTVIVGQSFSFFSKSGVATPNVLSPYIVDGTGAANNVVGLYSTISGKTFELFATISGKTIGGSMNFATPPPAVTNTVTAVTATPWIFGDCAGDTIPKSFHVHEFITYSRTLLEYERQIVEGYLYWKWLI